MLGKETQVGGDASQDTAENFLLCDLKLESAAAVAHTAMIMAI